MISSISASTHTFSRRQGIVHAPKYLCKRSSFNTYWLRPKHRQSRVHKTYCFAEVSVNKYFIIYQKSKKPKNIKEFNGKYMKYLINFLKKNLINSVYNVIYKTFAVFGCPKLRVHMIFFCYSPVNNALSASRIDAMLHSPCVLLHSWEIELYNFYRHHVTLINQLNDLNLTRYLKRIYISYLVSCSWKAAGYFGMYKTSNNYVHIWIN